jgi:hypothetical protein
MPSHVNVSLFGSSAAMRGMMIKAAIVAALPIVAAPATSSADAAVPMALAESGRTRYVIVIGKGADYGEDLAAKELAHFLWGMTGAEFPVERDSEPVSDLEIVLGNTNRKGLDQIPDDLKTDNLEGFAIVREDAKLFIMGNSPRGTLYGVYDFLDIELGVKFLTAEVTHVPQAPTLTVEMQSRMFAPVIERRTIWEGLGGQSTRRNRMNGVSFGLDNSRLGGVVPIGPTTHTFSSLVPPDKHFETHPEYFSQIDGKRKREHNGLFTQLCMSNPEVAEIAIKTIRGWLGPEVKTNPYNKYIVSVTVNDTPYFCQCEECTQINKEEGVELGGNKMRFVNSIADQLAEEYPAISIETMLYHTELPKITKPASNVLIQMVHDPDWRYAFDDPTSKPNAERLQEFLKMKESIGDGYVYNWIKLGKYSSGSYLDPRPNLRFIARNIRIMTECGVRGYFCQTVQSRGTEMQDLRYYLLARAMWRPEIDSRETIREFCNLYYSAGAPDVIRYIDFLHDEYGRKDRSRETQSDTTVLYGDAYITTGDAILAAAESKAETPEIKHRVATCRLPIWKLKLDRAFGEVGKIYSFPVEWSFKIDPENQGLDAGFQKITDFDGWVKMRIDTHWTSQGEERRGTGWYGINFDLADANGAPLALWFGAVDGDADIFIDGIKIGEQKLPATSMWQHGFFIPLPESLAPGEHTIVIKVFKPNYAAGIWKEISIIDMSVPLSPDLRTAGERFLETAKAADLTFLSESYGGPYTQTKGMYYPKIRHFLTHGK